MGDRTVLMSKTGIVRGYETVIPVEIYKNIIGPYGHNSFHKQCANLIE